MPEGGLSDAYGDDLEALLGAALGEKKFTSPQGSVESCAVVGTSMTSGNQRKTNTTGEVTTNDVRFPSLSAVRPLTTATGGRDIVTDDRDESGSFRDPRSHRVTGDRIQMEISCETEVEKVQASRV